jgi:hypothetical protein
MIICTKIFYSQFQYLEGKLGDQVHSDLTSDDQSKKDLTSVGVIIYWFLEPVAY